jgi:hypothetical protein
MSRTKTLLAMAICLAFVAPIDVRADSSVGDIQAFYNSSSNFGLGVLDGTVFNVPEHQQPSDHQRRG